MPFDPDTLERLARSRTVRIETQAPDGPVHRATIWAVVHEDRVFVRSWKGATARWYREAVANPAVALHLGKVRLPATAIPASDPDSIERCSDALREKYPGNPSTESMLRAEILETTLRIEPA
jgi:hypothetical protein